VSMWGWGWVLGEARRSTCVCSNCCAAKVALRKASRFFLFWGALAFELRTLLLSRRTRL
jgi:hypothetical protein